MSDGDCKSNDKPGNMVLVKSVNHHNAIIKHYTLLKVNESIYFIYHNFKYIGKYTEIL